MRLVVNVAQMAALEEQNQAMAALLAATAQPASARRSGGHRRSRSTNGRTSPAALRPAAEISCAAIGSADSVRGIRAHQAEQLQASQQAMAARRRVGTPKRAPGVALGFAGRRSLPASPAARVSYLPWGGVGENHKGVAKGSELAVRHRGCAPDGGESCSGDENEGVAHAQLRNEDKQLEGVPAIAPMAEIGLIPAGLFQQPFAVLHDDNSGVY